MNEVLVYGKKRKGNKDQIRKYKIGSKKTRENVKLREGFLKTDRKSNI